jgi:hypothetical protein
VRRKRARQFLDFCAGGPRRNEHASVALVIWRGRDCGGGVDQSGRGTRPASRFGILGYPEVDVKVSPDGVEAPSTLEAGHYLVTLSAS